MWKVLLFFIFFSNLCRRKKQTRCRTTRKEKTNLSKVLEKEEPQISFPERENQRVIRSESREQLALSVSKSKPVSTEDEREKCNASKVALLNIKSVFGLKFIILGFCCPERFTLNSCFQMTSQLHQNQRLNQARCTVTLWMKLKDSLFQCPGFQNL